MIIKSLKIDGFKGFEKEYIVNFDEAKTIIEGENFKGKTSIGEAICWCFLGTNLFGNDKTVNFVNKNKSNACCELEFIDNESICHTLIRSKGKENIAILDGVRTTQETLSKYYYEKKVFLAIYNPYYFSSLEPREQRDLLRGLLPKIDYRDAFEMLSQAERDILKEPRIDLNGFIKNSRDAIKELDKEENNLEGKRQYALSISTSDPGVEKIFNRQKELDLLEFEYENVLKSIAGETKQEMQNRLEELDSKIEKYTKSLNEMRTKYKEQIKLMQNILEDTTVCPVCKNKIVEQEKSEEIRNNMQEEINRIIANGKEIEAEIKNLKCQKNILYIKCNSLNPNNEKEELLSSIREKILILKLEKENIQKNNYDVLSKTKAIEKANNDIRLINIALEETRGDKELLKNQISIATSLNNLIIKKQMDMVKKYLDRVEIVFSKVDKSTGEIKDCYQVFYDNKEFNVLSLSEKIRANLEISNLLNNLIGCKIPTFIDNSESITHYNNVFLNQVILAKVVENKDLEIKNKVV